MKKTIVICFTAILCCAIIATPLMLNWYSSQNESADAISQIIDATMSVETKIDNADYPYAAYRVILSDYDAGRVMMINDETGYLYNIYFNRDNLTVYRGDFNGHAHELG